MSETNRHGRREASGAGASPRRYLRRYKAWLAGLTRGQRIRYRCLQAATAAALLVIIFYAALSAWIRVPELPDPNKRPQGGGPDTSGDVSFDGAQAPDIALSGRKAGVYTFLVAGRDVASGATDTILLLSFDTNEKTVSGLNLPRDTMINTSASSKRLNTVYARNRGSRDLSEGERTEKGMEALKKEVANLTGITPDFYVLVEWDAIGELVDALGGVEFEVPFDMDYDDPYQDLHIHQKAGLRELDGEDAMQVIRWRKNNTGPSGGDIARLAVQQDFLKAVVKECLQPATFLKVPELARIFTENVTTDLSVGNILALAQKAYGMDPEKGVRFETAPLAASFSYNRAALVTLDPEGILEIVNGGMNPYLRDIEARDLQVVYRNSNGSFGVTNAQLADAKMGQAPVRAPDPEPEPEEPADGGDGQQGTGDGSQNSGQPGTGDGSAQGGAQDPGNQPPDGGQPPAQGGENQTGGGDSSQGGGLPDPIDPGQIFPDPNAEPSQDIGAKQAGSGAGAVPPLQPQPAQSGV